MKHYNRDARASLKHITRKHTRARTQTHTPSTQLYDGYDRIEYIPTLARETHARTPHKYVTVVNAMNAVNAMMTHTEPSTTHLANAPYRAHPLAPTDAPLTRPEPPEPTPIADTRAVKAIVYNNAGTEMLWCGIIQRTLHITPTQVTVTLHKGKHDIPVKPYAPLVDAIHGMSIADIRACDVEFYKI